MFCRAPGGVDDEHVDAGLGRLLDSVPDDAGGIAAFGAGDDRHADAGGPGPQLADRGGAEGVAGGEHDAVILLHQEVRELGDGGGLARAVDADDEDHLGAGESGDLQRHGHAGERRLDLLGDDQADAEFLHVALERALGEARPDLAAVSGPRSEAISASSMSSSVPSSEPRAAEAGEIADEPV